MVHSIAVLLLLATAATAAPPQALAPADDTAIRAVIERYRLAWLRNDEAGVLGTFAADAVIMPHHGGPPTAGLAAIRSYWFSPGPKTTITAFDMTIDEIYRDGSMAFVRGHTFVRWTVETAGGLERWSNSGTFVNVMVARDRVWKTRLQMWDDPPNTRDLGAPR